MNVKAYVYVEAGDRTLCFTCAVREVQEQFGETKRDEEFDLALEEGDTGDGCDMRSTPKCSSCGKTLRDFCIA